MYDLGFCSTFNPQAKGLKTKCDFACYLRVYLHYSEMLNTVRKTPYFSLILDCIKLI